MEAQCSFDKRCTLVPDPDGMCPRHAMLSKELGARDAVRAEDGVPCYGCGAMADVGSVAKCKRCLQDEVCASCRSKSSCCKQKAKELEEEAEGLESEAEELRDRADKLKSRAA